MAPSEFDIAPQEPKPKLSLARHSHPNMTSTSAVVVLSLALLGTALALPPLPVNWFAPKFQGSLTFNGQAIKLQGLQVWQMDGVFNRSSYVSVDGFSSSFMDWDGKTYGDPSVYFYDVGYSCDHWCPLISWEQCGEAEGLCDYDMLTNSTFKNQTVIDGQLVDTWVWGDYAVFGQANNTLSFLHDTQMPFFRTDYATLGGNFENLTETYGGFKAGLPNNNNWYNVPNPGSCQQGDSCDQLKTMGLWKYIAMLRYKRGLPFH